MKVLIVKLSSLGDIIHCLFALREFLSHFPQARVHWLVQPEYAGLLQIIPRIEKVIPCDIRDWRKGAFRLERNLRELRQLLTAEKYDYAIDAQGMLKSALIRYSLGNIPYYGWHFRHIKEKPANFFYRYRIKIPLDAINQTKKIKLLFANIFGYRVDTLNLNSFSLFPLSQLSEQVMNKGASVELWYQAMVKQKLIALLFTGTSWPSKQLPAKLIAAIVKNCQDKNLLLFLPVHTEQDKARLLTELEDSKIPNHNLKFLVGLDFATLVFLISKTQIVFAPDTGMAYLSSLLGVRSVTFFGPTDPKVWSVPSCYQENILPVRTDLSCVPCHKRVCAIKKNQLYSECFNGAYYLD